MGNAVIDMSMSLDGYIAAPNDNPEQGLGEDGMRLHNWAFDDPSVFERVYGNLVEETGAVIMGRRSYDNSIAAWGGKGPLGEVPCFVVTHRPVANPDPVFTFVTDGIESALAKAREAAGEKRILVDVLLGGGRRLFDHPGDRTPWDLSQQHSARGTARIHLCLAAPKAKASSGEPPGARVTRRTREGPQRGPSLVPP